jgi:hypothetical protein
MSNITEILEREYKKATCDKKVLVEKATARLRTLSINFKSFLRTKQLPAREFPKSLFHYQGVQHSFNFKIKDSGNTIEVCMYTIDIDNSNNNSTQTYKISSLSDIDNEKFDSWVLSNAMEQFFREN